MKKVWIVRDQNNEILAVYDTRAKALSASSGWYYMEAKVDTRVTAFEVQ